MKGTYAAREHIHPTAYVTADTVRQLTHAYGAPHTCDVYDNMEHEALIELVKQHEVVYNTQCSKYRDISLRIAAWEEIARVLQKPVEDCKDQWNKLRNCYNNAMKRRERPVGSKRFAPWRFEQQMAFLKEHRSRLHTDSQETASSPELLASPEPVSYIEMQPTSPLSDYTIKEPLYSADVTEDHSRQELDEIDHFFLSMSKSVKRLPRLEQVRVKMEIHRAVSEAEVRLLEIEDADVKRFKFT